MGTRRVSGFSAGVDGEVEDFDMRCQACGTLQTEPLDAETSWQAQIVDVTCLWCGRVGTMARAPKAKVA